MSIIVHDYIAWGLAPGGGLVEAKPWHPRTFVRRIIMTEEIEKLFTGPWTSPDPELSDSEWEYRCGFIHRNFDRFLNGKRVTMALAPSSEADNCFLKRLDPIEDEVWEIRCVEPSPGVRVFGRFAETNIFVALHWRLRKEMGYWGDPQWDDAIWTVKQHWGIFFRDSKPKQSENVNDYVARNAIPV